MSSFTRRKFIGTAVVAGAAAASSGGVLGQIASIPTQGVGRDSLSKLDWNAFLPFVNTDFTFGDGLNAVVLRLVDMKDSRAYGTKARSSGQENFTLHFTGPGRSPLKEGTYHVNHFNLGDFSLFISPAGERRRLNLYTAVINRVTTPE